MRLLPPPSKSEETPEPTHMLAFLRKQNEKLKAEIESLKGEALPSYRPQIDNACRKCAMYAPGSKSGEDGESTKCFRGPAYFYEPAFNPRWWQRLWGAKPRPERMRRECKWCTAVYYEQVSALNNEP